MLNTFGWRAIASLSDSPASTSLRVATIVSFSILLSVCSSSTYSARRMLIPEEIIVASWRANTASSVALTLSKKVRLISREECLSAMSSTTSPRDFSWSETACLESASTSPLALTPARSIALKT